MYPVGVQMVSTVTVEASGTVSVYPAASNQVFSKLAISVIPQDATVEYKIDVYHDGELEETHTYPDASDRVIAHMLFPNLIFPANVGTHSIPKYFGDSEKQFAGIPISLVITNNSSTRKTFLVYSTFEEYDGCRFAQMPTALTQ
jgi:hypothetical protein